MHLEDYKMTGPEFKELYKRVKRKHRSVQDFADYLGIGRTETFKAFRSDHIPVDIEEAIDRDQELVKIKNKILKGPQFQESKSAEVYGPNKDLLREMFNTVNGYAKNLMKVNQELTESSRYFREVVQKAEAAGAIKYSFDKTKAITVQPKAS
jgi:hypothetical protein